MADRAGVGKWFGWGGEWGWLLFDEFRKERTFRTRQRCGHSEIVQTDEVSADDPLNAYGANFYQGIADDVADLEELASRALEFLSPEQRDALRGYLRNALDRHTPSELKGKLNRAIREYGFNSKSAVAFLHATSVQLERSS